MKALFYLVYCRLLNSALQAIRHPRLLIPGLLILVALAVQVTSFLMMSDSTTIPTAVTPNELLAGKPGAYLVTMRGVLLLSAITQFIAALGEGHLFFDKSDVDFLFPAPLFRGQVLLFKMLGRYAGLFFPAAYLPLAFAGAYLVGIPLTVEGFFPGMLGSWLFLLSTTNLTQLLLLTRPGKGNGRRGTLATFSELAPHVAHWPDCGRGSDLGGARVLAL